MKKSKNKGKSKLRIKPMKYINGTSKDGDANNANSNKPINAEVMTIQIGKKDTAKAIMPKQKTTPAPKKK